MIQRIIVGASPRVELIWWAYRTLHAWHPNPRSQRFRRWVLQGWFDGQLDRRYGAFIDPAAKIGQVILVHQFHGIFIGGAASIGDWCVLHHRVTIGSTAATSKRPIVGPQIGNNVLIGADVTLIGGCLIGDGAKIGAGVTLTHAKIDAGATIINKSAYDLTNKRYVYPQD